MNNGGLARGREYRPGSLCIACCWLKGGVVAPLPCHPKGGAPVYPRLFVGAVNGGRPGRQGRGSAAHQVSYRMKWALLLLVELGARWPTRQLPL